MVNVKEIVEQLSGKQLNENDDLFNNSVMDSLGLIQLLSKLEDEGIEIPITRIDRNIFRTISSIQKYVDELCGGFEK